MINNGFLFPADYILKMFLYRLLPWLKLPPCSAIDNKLASSVEMNDTDVWTVRDAAGGASPSETRPT